MSDVKWIIHRDILQEGSTSDFPRVIREQGFDVFETTYNLNSREIEPVPYTSDECVVIYGSFNYVNKLVKSGYSFIPGAYGLTSDVICSYYLPLLPKEFILNDDYIVMSWGEFVRRKEFLQHIYGDAIFIRPNSGFKTFSGFSMSFDDWDYEVKTRQSLTSVMHDSLVLISSSKKIYSEYRFVVCDRRVVTGSRYHVNCKLNESSDVDIDCQKLAEKMAELPWQLDTCYTCDIGLTDSGAKLVELNSFGCAGLYKCDLNLIVRHVSIAALRDFRGD